MNEDKEAGIMAMYEGSAAKDEDLYETSNVNQLAWTLLVFACGVIVWLCVALVHAENQRYALASGKCQDPAFPGQIDQRCLPTVHSRDHWWEHLWYAIRQVN
jgi:hypothetical protein